MKIVRKREIVSFIKNFEVIAKYDGEKYYITFGQISPKGTVTIMKYVDTELKSDSTLIGESYTYHRTNESFSDIKEIPVDIDTLKELIWQHRKAINQSMKVTVK
jgi:hypothetical protein